MTHKKSAYGYKRHLPSFLLIWSFVQIFCGALSINIFKSLTLPSHLLQQAWIKALELYGAFCLGMTQKAEQFK